MVEIIKVREWDVIDQTYGLFHIKLKTKEDLFKIAKEYEVPFVFESNKNMAGVPEFLFIYAGTAYWYKP